MTKLFHQYYDQLFASKDYAKEIDCIFSQYHTFYKSKFSRILEIGCGTGNHTLWLAKKKADVVAIDIDPCMIEIALPKINKSGFKNVKLICKPLEEIKETGFDIALAMFNVISYIDNTDSLMSFLKEVYKRLHLGGLFVFDCWNGIAAIKDPPQSKTFEKKTGSILLKCHLTCSTDFFKQKALLRYNLKIKDTVKNVTSQENFSFSQTLWTPVQIRYCLHKQGFIVKDCCKLLQPFTAADEKDWKIMFACKKL